MASKPIRVFWSPRTKRFYASRQYQNNKNGTVTITGDKFDVTQDIARIVIEEEVTFSYAGDKQEADNDTH